MSQTFYHFGYGRDGHLGDQFARETTHIPQPITDLVHRTAMGLCQQATPEGHGTKWHLKSRATRRRAS